MVDLEKRLRPLCAAENHEGILAACDELLGEDLGREAKLSVIRTKCVALLHLSQNDKVAEITDGANTESTGLLRAYGFYAEKKNVEADELLKTMGSVKSADRLAVMHLRSQLAYRLHDFAGALSHLCAAMGKARVQVTDCNGDAELACNLSAVLLALGRSQQVADWRLSDDLRADADLMSNIALAKGVSAATQWPALVSEMAQSVANCQASLKREGLTEDEINSELLTLQLIRALFLWRAGRCQDSSALLSQLQQYESSEILGKIAAHNLAVAKNELSVLAQRCQEMLDCKDWSQVDDRRTGGRLPAAQTQVVCNLLLALAPVCDWSSAQKLLRQYKAALEPFSWLWLFCTAAVKHSKVEAAIHSLTDALRRGGFSQSQIEELSLMKAQLLVETDVDSAIDALQAVAGHRGAICTVVQLCLRSANVTRAKELAERSGHLLESTDSAFSSRLRWLFGLVSERGSAESGEQTAASARRALLHAANGELVAAKKALGLGGFKAHTLDTSQLLTAIPLPQMAAVATDEKAEVSKGPSAEKEKRSAKDYTSGSQGGAVKDDSLRVFDREVDKAKKRFSKANLPAHIKSRRRRG